MPQNYNPKKWPTTGVVEELLMDTTTETQSTKNLEDILNYDDTFEDAITTLPPEGSLDAFMNQKKESPAHTPSSTS